MRFGPSRVLAKPLYNQGPENGPAISLIKSRRGMCRPGRISYTKATASRASLEEICRIAEIRRRKSMPPDVSFALTPQSNRHTA
jgi:hypothetical protein